MQVKVDSNKDHKQHGEIRRTLTLTLKKNTKYKMERMQSYKNLTEHPDAARGRDVPDVVVSATPVRPLVTLEHR